MGNEGNLFNRFCRDVGANYNLFPIDLKDWKEVSDQQRAYAWVNIVKKKFEMTENKAVRSYAIKKIGDGWKTKRNDYFNKRNPSGNRPLAEIVDDVPPGVSLEAWARYATFRYGPIGQERSRAGKEARSHQVVRHTTGSRPFSVILGEMLRKGREQGRLTQDIVRDFLLEIRRHSDGSYVPYSEDELAAMNQAAKEFADTERLDNDENDKEARVIDPFEVIARLRAAIGAREHSGRVPGLGFGATPSQIYRTRDGHQECGGTSGSQSYEERQVEDCLQKQFEERMEEQEHLWEEVKQEREELKRERGRSLGGRCRSYRS